MPEEIEIKLIRRAQDNDLAALSAIYDRLQGVVFRYLYYRVGDYQTAEDLTSDVFIRVIKALPRYKQKSVPFRAWVMKIARNLAVDYYRRAGFRDHLELKEELLISRDRPDRTVEQNLTSAALAQALRRLTEDQRDVITLRFLAEMSIIEVGMVLGKNESAVKALQRRGLRALHKILEDWKVSDD